MFMSIIMFYALEKIARLMFSPGSYRSGMLAGQKNGDQEEAVSEINLKIERYLKREVSKFEGDPNLVKVTCRYNAVLHIRKFVKIEPKGERGVIFVWFRVLLVSLVGGGVSLDGLDFAGYTNFILLELLYIKCEISGGHSHSKLKV